MVGEENDEFLDRSLVILKVRPTLLGLTDARGMVETVGPHRME
jgi:hypothetical protein